MHFLCSFFQIKWGNWFMANTGQSSLTTVDGVDFPYKSQHHFHQNCGPTSSMAQDCSMNLQSASQLGGLLVTMGLLSVEAGLISPSTDSGWRCFSCQVKLWLQTMDTGVTSPFITQMQGQSARRKQWESSVLVMRLQMGSSRTGMLCTRGGSIPLEGIILLSVLCWYWNSWKSSTTDLFFMLSLSKILCFLGNKINYFFTRFVSLFYLLL